MVNAGDVPLISVVSSNTTLMHIEVAESVKGSAPFVNEVQRITIVTNGTSAPMGSFGVNLGRDQTSPLAVNVSATDLASGLRQLSSTRENVNVDRGTGDSLSWTVTFTSPGPQALLSSPCQATVDGKLSPDCLLEDASVEIKRVVRGSSPASGTFRLRLIPAGGNIGNTSVIDASTTPPLPFDAAAEQVQTALVRLVGGEKASVTVAPNTRAGYGFDWGLTLHDTGASSVELVDVNIDGPGPWCADGSTGPAIVETPCEFPFMVDKDGHDVQFTCAGAVGSSPGWCSTSSTFDESRDWGGCMRCAKDAIASPSLHVASLRRSFRLRGQTSQVYRALSEVVYHPRPLWNAWLGGHDEVSAYWYDDNSLESSKLLSGAKASSVAQVFVAPVNDPPTVTIRQKQRIAYEGKELLLEDADVWDPDLTDRPEIVVRVLLEAELGTLALGDHSGLTFESGSPEPHSSGRLMVTGPLYTLRTAMQQIYYRPLTGLAAGAAAVRATQEVQRIELTAPVVPMVQSIATFSTKGYIEGNFTLYLNCSVFVEAVDDIFPEINVVNDTSTASYTPGVYSPQIAANAPATGNGSMETGIRGMLTGCVGLAWDRAALLAEYLNTTSFGNSSSTANFTENALPHRAAAAVVSRGEPDRHGCLTWSVTLVDVPPLFPVLGVASSNLTVEDTGFEESLYANNSSSSQDPSVSVTVVQDASSLSGPTGSFTLTSASEGETTERISTFASDEDVAAALTSLADIGAVHVSTGPLLTSSPATPALGRYWEVTFLRSGFPVHVGDLPPLQANGEGIQAQGAVVRVSEVIKGQAPTDAVTVVVNDLGNVGEGGALQASAAWNIIVVPQDVPPVIHVNWSAEPHGFFEAIEGTVLQLAGVQISHAVSWEVTAADSSRDLHYMVRLVCSRGAVKPDSSVVGQDLVVMLASATVTVLSGTLSEVNRALSSLNYYAPRRYRGVDDVEIAARLAGLGVHGGWGASKLYVFVDGVNNPPELSAPRLLSATGVTSVAVSGISVVDDDPGGIMTVTIEAARGLVSIPPSHRLQPLDGSEVRSYII